MEEKDGIFAGMIDFIALVAILYILICIGFALQKAGM